MSALIIGRPGPLSEALRALLMTIPKMGWVNLVSDTTDAVSVVIEDSPDLVILDASLFSEQGLGMLREHKKDLGGRRYLVLTDDAQQQHSMQLAGADVAVPKGFPPDKLFEVIEALMV